MTTATHASMAGADLHEPKGVAAATINKVYVSDGAGSGSWAKLPASCLTIRFPDIGAVSSVYIVIPYTCTVNKIWTAVQTIPTAVNTILTCKNNAGSSMGIVTVAFSGAAAGDVDFLVPVTNNTFTAGQILTITSDGGATNVVEAMVVIDLTITG